MVENVKNVSMIQVEIVYAEPQRQFQRCVTVPEGTDIADAIAASGVAAEFGIDVDTLATGIWYRRVARETILRDGDRVELYRPLRIDPKEARRRRAANPDYS